MTDRERISFPMDPATANSFWRMAGAAEVVTALEEIPAGQRPIGFTFALTIAQRELAELKITHSGRVLRAAAAAGHDINRYRTILTRIERQQPLIELEETDLVDLAEVSK